MKSKKPEKKTDRDLWSLLNKKISCGDYLFLKHAKKRLQERQVIDLEVLNILERKNYCNSKRNKSKDVYHIGYQDWCYCVEGDDLNGTKLRIIVSFDIKLMLIITVIRLENEKEKL